MSGEPWPRLLGDHTIQDGERGDEGWQQLWGSAGPLVILQPLWDAPDMQIMQWNWTSAHRERWAKQEYRKTISGRRVLSTIFVLLGCDQCRVCESRCSCMYVYDIHYSKIKLESSCWISFMEIMWGFGFHVVEFAAKNRFLEKCLWHPCDFKGAVDHIWKYWFDKQRAIQIVIGQNILPKFEDEGYCLFTIAVKTYSCSHHRTKAIYSNVQFTKSQKRLRNLLS